MHVSRLNEDARNYGITILGEIGLDPGIDHMMAKKLINQAYAKKGAINSFTSYCGGFLSPEAANHPLGYEFRAMIQQPGSGCLIFQLLLWSVSQIVTPWSMEIYTE
ncbi:hypothetical protein MKX03_011513 [Papaver bracteatum]|nr:hypothetical protein MKX03_011513 [Papaver bracteatum]